MRVHHSHGSSFETKYVLTLLDRILVNTWRAEVDITIMKPWSTQFHKEHRKYPTSSQIRRKVHHHKTINDFVETFAICYLQVLQRDSVNPLPSQCFNCCSSQFTKRDLKLYPR